MSKIRFLWDNKADIATLWPSSEVSSLPVKNIQHPHRKLVWRTTTNELQCVELNLSTAQLIRAIAIINHNFYNSNLKLRLLGSSLPQVGGALYGQQARLWDWIDGGKDRSSAGMHLTPHGTVGTPTISWNGDPGGFGFQCYFDRADAQYWEHPDNNYLDVGTGNFTIMGWVKTSYMITCQTIINKRQVDPSLGYFFQLYCSGGTVGRLNLRVASTSGEADIYGNTTTVADNARHHVAVAVNRTSNLARFYLDGSPDSDWQSISAIAQGTLDNDVTFQVGSTVEHTNLFDGYMGPVHLVKQLLSDAQIATAASQPAIKEALDYHDKIIIKNISGGNYPYWRLEFDNPDNPDDHIDIGRVFLGDYFESSRQFARGWEELLVDPSRIEQSEQGQEWVDLREKHRLIRVEFPEGAPLSETDREKYKEMLDAVGCSKDLFIALDYDNKPNDWSLYGKFAQSEFNFREFLAGLFSTGFDFKESR